MQRLYQMLDKYIGAGPDELDGIEAEIWNTLGVEKTVLVVDMSGFSRITREEGLVRFMAMVRLMQQTTRPIAERFRGAVLKYEADNLFALFDRVKDAADAAVAMNIAFESTNIVMDPVRDIHICAGVDKGRLLYDDGADAFGDAVNIASKLGEDAAGPGEILISKRAWQDISELEDVRAEAREFSISGLTLEAVALQY